MYRRAMEAAAYNLIRDLRAAKQMTARTARQVASMANLRTRSGNLVLAVVVLKLRIISKPRFQPPEFWKRAFACSRQLTLIHLRICQTAEKAALRSARISLLPEGQHRVDFCCTSSWKPTAEDSSERNQADLYPEAARVSRLKSWEHPTQNPH